MDPPATETACPSAGIDPSRGIEHRGCGRRRAHRAASAVRCDEPVGITAASRTVDSYPMIAARRTAAPERLSSRPSPSTVGQDDRAGARGGSSARRPGPRPRPARPRAPSAQSSGADSLAAAAAAAAAGATPAAAPSSAKWSLSSTAAWATVVSSYSPGAAERHRGERVEHGICHVAHQYIRNPPLTFRVEPVMNDA